MLDDVWMQEVVAAFDVRCTVLITTRDIGVMNRVSGKLLRPIVIYTVDFVLDKVVFSK